MTIGRDDGGFYIPAAFVSKSWVVVLNEDWEDEDFESAVAHELAHLSPKHRPADLFLDVEKNENEAAARVREWGFSGIGSVSFSGRPR